MWARDLIGGDQNNSWGWFFLRGSDGNIYVIQQDGLPRNGVIPRAGAGKRA